MSHPNNLAVVMTQLVKDGHDDTAAPQFCSRKGRGPYKGPYDRCCRDRQCGNHSGGVGGPGPRLILKDRDGDIIMSDRSKDKSSQKSFKPYRPFRTGDGLVDRVRRQGGPFRGGARGGGGGKNQLGWYKVTIPNGSKCEKKWLLTALQNICSIQYQPVQYHVDHNTVHFYVDESSVASALRKCSHKITDTDGSKVEVHVNKSAPPSFLISDPDPDPDPNPECLKEHLKQCMGKRFYGNLGLDLSSIRTDPDLVSKNIRVILSRKSNMKAVVKIIVEDITELTSLNLSDNRIHKLNELVELVTEVPYLKTLDLSHNELKSDQELDKVKGLKLVELSLTGNPLCELFKDQASYISAVRQRFPRLLKLDGHDLPPPIELDVETPTTILPCKGSCLGSDDIELLVHRFLRHYYSVYDSGDRQPLLDAYHDGASLSVTTPDSRRRPGDSETLKTVKESMKHFELLKQTRPNVVAFLNELPKTQHDLHSFTIDVNTCTDTLLSFTVGGLCKEVVVVDGKSRESTMAFSRVFITVPATNCGLCVVSDQLTVQMATPEEIRRAFVAPAPAPCSSLISTLTSTQQLEMVMDFSLKTEMNLEWSQKCLQDNDWDFSKAEQSFTQLKAEGKIPDVAFHFCNLALK